MKREVQQEMAEMKRMLETLAVATVPVVATNVTAVPA